MKQRFQGWSAVSQCLQEQAEIQRQLAENKGEDAARLNVGQRASLHAIASRIPINGIVIADEVGMGKTRIAVELARSVIDSGGRVAILVPRGLGYQWQDELREGGINAPPILRSLPDYLAIWGEDEPEKPTPWFDEEVVVMSHTFTNWRLGKDTQPWRWALLPEVYARWRAKNGFRLPRGYREHEKLSDSWVQKAAESVTAAVPNQRTHPARLTLDRLLEKIQWPKPMDSTQYSRDGEMRISLERVVGVGLGVFDLVIIDEAHKSRGSESGLSRLLDNVILQSNAARRLAMTATPVELDVSQWHHTLRRIGLNKGALDTVQKAIDQYAKVVKRVRQSWRSNQEASVAYKVAANQFKKALSPYLLRRDKREDDSVIRFHEHSGVPINAYRHEADITVGSAKLSPAWRQAICAAEALSIVTRQAEDPVAKRLRLTLGNGHGISTLLDHVKRDAELDHKQEEYDKKEYGGSQHDEICDTGDDKREQRAQWWLNTVKGAFNGGDDSLFDHPAIAAGVTAIENATRKGEKVLVFGRFTRPMRAMVELLNAREMLRRLQSNEPWPQAKVHTGIQQKDDINTGDEWPAVRAAHRQLAAELMLGPLETNVLDRMLHKQYNRSGYHRQKFSDQLLGSLAKGFEQSLRAGQTDETDKCFNAFEAFARSVEKSPEDNELALVSRALFELLSPARKDYVSMSEPSELKRIFCALIKSASDRDDPDADANGDGVIDDKEADTLWHTLKMRLKEEFNRPQGGFARLMYGGTKPESRRMIQLAFNRPNSFPKVLVAQSMVGREGLNLHEACRIVVLLHPEWNPGVVEQQIGRVDRVGSWWSKQLINALAEDRRGGQLPRIEVRPVIFQGTYDEYNWQVLRERWDDLRAQLHGIVVPPRLVDGDPKGEMLVNKISEAAPNFSPSYRNITVDTE